MNAGKRAIRVMHVASGDLWAGAEVQVAELATALAKRPGMQVSAVLLNDGELASRLRKAAVETRVFREDRAATWSIYRQMTAFMRAWRPDVVHTHRQKENIVGTLAAYSAGVPVCLRTAHGAPEFIPGALAPHKRALRQLDRWLAKYGQQRVVAVSDELAEKLRHDLPATNICVIPNGIDKTAVRAAATPHVWLRGDAFHVAFVGRLAPVKRVDLFLHAAAELLQIAPKQYRFHIIGDGPLRADLERESASLGISTSCDFHGFQVDAPRWLAAMNCLVLTSDHEGLPMTALEARALGIPVVAHAVGGLVSLLQDANDSRLVATQNPTDYANAIRAVTAVSGDPANCRLPDRFEIASTSEAYATLYQSLLYEDPARKQ